VDRMISLIYSKQIRKKIRYSVLRTVIIRKSKVWNTAKTKRKPTFINSLKQFKKALILYIKKCSLDFQTIFFKRPLKRS